MDFFSLIKIMLEIEWWRQLWRERLLSMCTYKYTWNAEVGEPRCMRFKCPGSDASAPSVRSGEGPSQPGGAGFLSLPH